MEGIAATSAPANGSAQAMTSTPAPVKLPGQGGNAPKPTGAASDSLAGAGVDASKGSPEEFFDVDGEKIPKAELFKTFKNARQIYNESYKKFEEGAKYRKEAETKLSSIKTPKDAMKFLTDPKNGYNPQEVRQAFEEWYSDTFIAPEMMSPEQRRIAELEKHNEELERKWQTEQKTKEEQENKRLDEMGSNALQREIVGILEESGLEKTKFNLARIAYWIRVNESKGISAPKNMVIQQVQNEFNGILKQAVTACGGSGEKLVKVLGEDVVRAIRKYDIEQIRARRNGVTQNQQNSKPEEPSVKFENGRPKILRPEDVKRLAREFR